MTERTLKFGTLRELATTNAITKVIAVGVRGGFEIKIEAESSAWLLGNNKGTPRCFVSLITLSNCLGQCGVTRFEVDATHYVQERLRKPRPDRSVALKRTKTQPNLELV